MALLFIASLTFIVTFLDELDLLDDESDASCFMCFRRFFFLLHSLLLDLIYLLSLDESDSLYDESDDDGSDSGSSGTCYFLLCFDNSAGCVSGLVSGVLYQQELIRNVTFLRLPSLCQ